MWIFIFHFRWKHSVHESLPSAAHSNSKHQNFTPDSAQVHVHNFNIFSPARTYDKWKHWIYAADARNRVFHIILQPTASESLPHEDCVEERKKKQKKVRAVETDPLHVFCSCGFFLHLTVLQTFIY